MTQRNRVPHKRAAFKYDLTGQKFGRYTVLKYSQNRNGRRYWECRCDCGNIREVSTAQLINGMSRSCGCLKVDMQRKKFLIEHGLAAKHDVYRNYKMSARRKKLPFGLSFEDFLMIASKDCYYCGSPPLNKSIPKGNNGDFVYQGIDRKDNSRGYMPDNILPCCDMCNKAKRHKTYEEFIAWLRRIANTWTDTN